MVVDCSIYKVNKTQTQTKQITGVGRRSLIRGTTVPTNKTSDEIRVVNLITYRLSTTSYLFFYTESSLVLPDQLSVGESPVPSTEPERN